MPAATIPFVHGYVGQAALAAYHRAEEDLVAPFAAQAPADPEPDPVPVAAGGDPAPITRAVERAPLPAAAPFAAMTQSAPDLAAPRARLTARRGQRLGSRLRIEVTCFDEACGAVARATVGLPKVGARRARTYASAPARRSIASGARARIVIRLPRSLAVAGARASRAGRSVRARVSVVVTDAAGNRRTLTRHIVLTP